MASKRNFTEGPLFWRVTVFAIPIMMTGLLQIFYNMADNIVVGKFSGDSTALAAVGSTLTFITFMVNVLMGICLGAGVVVGQYFGAGDEEKTSRSLHTAVGLSVVLGFIFGILGFIFTPTILEMLNTKPELMDSAILYLRIICIGIPAQTVYNMGAVLQRSAGNSGIALYVLGFTGLLNVILNLIFVIFLDMSVDGVALATVIANISSAILILISLARRNDSCRLYLKRIRMEWHLIKRILRFGLPAGIQSGVFATANMILTAALNQLSIATVYAYTVVSNIDSITNTAMNAYSQTAAAVIAQNYGAKKLDRVVRSYLYSLFWSVAVAVLCGQLSILFGEQLSSLFIGAEQTNPGPQEIIDAAVPMLKVALSTMFLCGIMNVAGGSLRSMGYSLASMIGCIVCVVGGRLMWIYFVFPMERFHSGAGLIASFPAAWALASVALTAILVIAMLKTKKKFAIEAMQRVGDK